MKKRKTGSAPTALAQSDALRDWISRQLADDSWRIEESAVLGLERVLERIVKIALEQIATWHKQRSATKRFCISEADVIKAIEMVQWIAAHSRR